MPDTHAWLTIRSPVHNDGNNDDDAGENAGRQTSKQTDCLCCQKKRVTLIQGTENLSYYAVLADVLIEKFPHR